MNTSQYLQTNGIENISNSKNSEIPSAKATTEEMNALDHINYNLDNNNVFVNEIHDDQLFHVGTIIYMLILEKLFGFLKSFTNT